MIEKTDKEIRVIKTLHFGELEISPEHIFHFEDGMLGFDGLREYVLISEEETVPFKWLISMEQPEIGFPMLSPWHIDLSYKAGKNIDLEKEVLLVVVTLENEKGKMTANMKAPVVLNVETQKGRQEILPSDKYSVSHVITGSDIKEQV